MGWVVIAAGIFSAVAPGRRVGCTAGTRVRGG